MRMPNGVLMEEGNGVLSTLEHDAAMVNITGIGWAGGKGRRALILLYDSV